MAKSTILSIDLFDKNYKLKKDLFDLKT